MGSMGCGSGGVPGRLGSLRAGGGALLGACALVAGLLPSPPLAASTPAPAPVGTVPRRADEAAVLRGLLAEALGAGTDAPLIGFIARYPDEPLAEAARQALRARPTADRAPAPGPDGEIFLAFDMARLGGTPALERFAARYPTHPLAAEARRPVWQR